MSYDITELKRKVITMYPFFGSIAASIEYIEDKEAEVIEAKDDIIFYDPVRIAELSENDRIFSLAHELCHIAFEHDKRGKGKEPVLWEMAADAVINQLLKRDGLEIIKGGVDHPEAVDHDAEEYYEMLLESKQAIDLVDGSLQGNEISDGNGPGGGQGDSSEEDKPTSDDAELREDEQSDEDTDEEEYVWVEKIESEAGNSVRRDTRTAEADDDRASLIDWRMVLHDSINYNVDWSYSDAVIEDHIVRPVLKEIMIPETEILLDTSWSVDEALLRKFLNECESILEISKLKIGCFDTVFYGFHEIRNKHDLGEIILEGGGGTDFNIAVDAFTLRADNRIIFTDGQAEMPDKYLDAVWIVYGGEKIEPAGGKVIHLA